MKKQSLKLLSLLFSTSILLTACTTQSSSQHNQQKVSKQIEKELLKQEKKQKEMKQHIKQQKKTIEKLTDELNYYRNYVKEVSMLLPKEKLQELINKEWKYSMTINNIEFPKDGVMEIKERNFQLIISEKKAPYSVLPEEESMKGKILSDLEAAVYVTNDKEEVISPKVTQHKKDVILTYSFKNVKPNSIIKINISDELAKKLEMNTKDLEIHVVE